MIAIFLIRNQFLCIKYQYLMMAGSLEVWGAMLRESDNEVMASKVTKVISIAKKQGVGLPIFQCVVPVRML